jgi:hypothetical protein
MRRVLAVMGGGLVEIRRTRKDRGVNPNLRDGGGEGKGGAEVLVDVGALVDPGWRDFHRRDAKFATTDKDSGITNDAKYPLELLLGTVTVILETNRVVAGLSGLEID